MGSEGMKLPTIDFRKSELKAGSEEWISMRDEVYHAMEEYGCFEALLDGAQPESLYEKLKQVFNFPVEIKMENSKTLFGYTKDHPLIPLKERMAIYHVLTPGVVESFSKLFWPDGEPNFCNLVVSYAKRLSEFEEMVRKMVFEKLGVERYLDEHTRSSNYILGFFKYRVPKAEETKVGLLAHTDKYITTVLSQHQVSGLQVMRKDGQWFNVQYSSPDSTYIFGVDSEGQN